MSVILREVLKEEEEDRELRQKLSRKAALGSAWAGGEQSSEGRQIGDGDVRGRRGRRRGSSEGGFARRGGRGRGRTHRITIYIAPLKALAAEVARSLGQILGRLDPPRKVLEVTGDVEVALPALEAASVLVCTPEKWDVITRKPTSQRLMDLAKVLIIDEVHILHEQRGPVLEAIVARTVRSGTPSDLRKRAIVNRKEASFFTDTRAPQRSSSAWLLAAWLASPRHCRMAQTSPNFCEWTRSWASFCSLPSRGLFRCGSTSWQCRRPATRASSRSSHLEEPEAARVAVEMGIQARRTRIL